MNKFRRILRHLIWMPIQVKKAFPQSVLNTIEETIRTSELMHTSELRFVVEGSLPGLPLYHGITPRARAIHLFSHLKIWDTDHRNGILIYLLLADRSVEIVVDRGVLPVIHTDKWENICSQMEDAFRKRHFETGVIEGIHSITHLLAQYFPTQGARKNELSNKVVVC